MMERKGRAKGNPGRGRGKQGGAEKPAGVLNEVAELFDLPPDVVAGLPRLELIGNRQLYLEHHRGLLSYSGECIDANTTAGVLRISGDSLTLLAMTGEVLRVGGVIRSLEWEGFDAGRGAAIARSKDTSSQKGNAPRETDGGAAPC